jgi:hypothetical protein
MCSDKIVLTQILNPSGTPNSSASVHEAREARRLHYAEEYSEVPTASHATAQFCASPRGCGAKIAQKYGKRRTVPVGLKKITPEAAKNQEKAAEKIIVPVELEITIISGVFLTVCLSKKIGINTQNNKITEQYDSQHARRA